MSNTNANFDMTGILLGQEVRKRRTPQEKIAIIQQTMEPGMNVSHVARLHGIQPSLGLAPIFPYTFYHLTHYWFAAADIPVANDTPVHYADAIRCNVRRPPQGSLPLLTRRVSA